MATARLGNRQACPEPRLPPSLKPLPPTPLTSALPAAAWKAALPSPGTGVSQSEPGWRAAGAETALAHPPSASRRRTKRRCRVSSALDDHLRVLFPEQTFCSPGYPALSEVRGPRNHPPLRTSNPESSDGTYSKTGALLRCLPALLPEPSASGPRVRGIHCQSCSSRPATQRRSQKRWRLADQRARTLGHGADPARFSVCCSRPSV